MWREEKKYISRVKSNHDFQPEREKKTIESWKFVNCLILTLFAMHERTNSLYFFEEKRTFSPTLQVFPLQELPTK